VGFSYTRFLAKSEFLMHFSKSHKNSRLDYERDLVITVIPYREYEIAKKLEDIPSFWKAFNV